MAHGEKKAEAEELGIVPGATVRLKSGGPLMTVTSVDDGKPIPGVISASYDGRVNTTWFVKDALRHGSFRYTTLDPED